MTVMALNHKLREFIILGHNESRWAGPEEFALAGEGGVFIQESV